MLIADTKGNLYGTTELGGNSNTMCAGAPSGTNTCGTAFKLTLSGKESVLYRFKGGQDAGNPRAGLRFLSDGSLVGATIRGGDISSSCKNGCGTAYELTKKGKKYKDRVIYAFGQGSTDGTAPFDSDGLIIDTAGNIYGTTVSAFSSCGCGTVFKLAPSGSGYTESLLHVFAGGTDGEIPFASVTMFKGELYGTTEQGGSTCYGTSYSCGTVYKVKP